MDAQELRNLQEAYNQVHQLDEGRNTSLRALAHESERRKADEKRGRPETDAETDGRLMMGNFRPGASREERAAGGRQRLRDRGKVPQKGGKDMFEHILEHLVAEGYADTNKAALAIMANMSEEWKQDIMEISDKRIMATRDALAKRTDRSVGRGDGNQYSRNVSREARMNARIQSRNQRTGSNVEPTDTRRHQ